VIGWKKATAGAAFLAAIAGGLPGLAGCASAPLICAGQCVPPFQLSVTFKPGTPAQAVSSELRQCSRGDANVIRVDELPRVDGRFLAVIYTHTLPELGPDRMQKCLYAEPHVLSATFAG
jgi:hypothetical protein